MNPILRANLLYGRCGCLSSATSRMKSFQQQQQQQQQLLFSRAAEAGLPQSMTLVRATSTFGPTQPFFDKQKALARPLSPHLTIYKPQITTMLSISHRISGLGMACGLYGFAIGALFMKGSFPEVVANLHLMHLSPAIIIPMKMIASGTFFFHYFNGIRHLCWDLGIGFKLKELYTSGTVVLVVASLASLYATFVL